MISNFITAPDYIKSVLIVNATESQQRACAETCRLISVPYNVYFYNEHENAADWVNFVYERVDQVLSPAYHSLNYINNLTFMTDSGNKIIYYGQDQEISEPAEYFNK